MSPGQGRRPAPGLPPGASPAKTAVEHQRRTCRTDLLATGAGLLELPAEHLKAAGLNLGPDHPFASAEFAEVAWRAGRTGIAVQLLDAFLAATPDQPSHADQRQILKAIRAAAVVDAAAADGSDWAPLADEATTLANELASGHEADYATIATFVNTATAARRALKAPGRSATEGL